MRNLERKLCLAIYPEWIVRKAAADYSKLAKIKLSNADDYILCEFHDCVLEPERIADEFENYLVELINSGWTSDDHL